MNGYLIIGLVVLFVGCWIVAYVLHSSHYEDSEE